jgi:hypothetical protein
LVNRDIYYPFEEAYSTWVDEFSGALDGFNMLKSEDRGNHDQILEGAVGFLLREPSRRSEG